VNPKGGVEVLEKGKSYTLPGGRAIGEAVSHWLPNTAARDRHGSGIYGGTVALSTSVSPAKIHSTSVRYPIQLFLTCFFLPSPYLTMTQLSGVM
jgi:hypothetical protein